MREYRLRSYAIPLPGGYSYVQPEPKGRKFPAQPMPEAQAQTVWDYRKGNGLPRASYAECLVDVDRYQCIRLGNNPMFCIPVNQDAVNQVAVASNAPGLQPCATCGAKVS